MRSQQPSSHLSRALWPCARLHVPAYVSKYSSLSFVQLMQKLVALVYSALRTLLHPRGCVQTTVQTVQTVQALQNVQTARLIGQIFIFTYCKELHSIEYVDFCSSKAFTTLYN